MCIRDRLSPKIYDSYSVTAAGVAAHEAGHALQDQQNYAPLQLRTNIVPAVQVGGWIGPLIFLAGFFISPALAWIGVLLFGLTVIFSLVTLPVECDTPVSGPRDFSPPKELSSVMK